MTFKLVKKSTGATVTTFHITDAAGTIYGSVNVPNEAATDLLKCWAGARSPGAGKQPAATAAKQTAGRQPGCRGFQRTTAARRHYQGRAANRR